MKKPVIGITCNFYLGNTKNELSRGYDLNYLGVKYPEYVRRAGGVPVLLPIVVMTPFLSPPTNAGGETTTPPLVPPRRAGGKNHGQDVRGTIIPPLSSSIIVGEVTTPPLFPPSIEGGIMDMVEAIDGLLLSGGTDVAPELYKESVLDKRYPGEIPRSAFEIELLKRTYERKKPVMGICRGIQLINVAFGGTLYQDLYLQRQLGNHELKEGQPPPFHNVILEPNSRLFKIIGKSPIRVNSSHHQAVKDLASGFSITATSEDGIIEGIELNDSTFVLGVQWHPERLENQEADALVRYLVEIAYQSRRR
jgi:putative glutamine amidotransferase